MHHDLASFCPLTYFLDNLLRPRTGACQRTHFDLAQPRLNSLCWAAYEDTRLSSTSATYSLYEPNAEARHFCTCPHPAHRHPAGPRLLNTLMRPAQATPRLRLGTFLSLLAPHARAASWRRVPTGATYLLNELTCHVLCQTTSQQMAPTARSPDHIPDAS